MSRMRKPAAALAVAGSLALPCAALGLPPFSKTPKSAPGSPPTAEVFGIAASCHATFDRFVIRTRFGTASYAARPVRKIISDGSGRTVRLKGRKRLRVVLRDTRAHTQSGGVLIPGVRTPLCPNLRQVKLAGDFEGVVTFGLGLRRKTGFRVFRLTSPSRVVVDVAH
jgi:hypothetical protein